jgi:hypothetical protein
MLVIITRDVIGSNYESYPSGTCKGGDFNRFISQAEYRECWRVVGYLRFAGISISFDSGIEFLPKFFS